MLRVFELEFIRLKQKQFQFLFKDIQAFYHENINVHTTVGIKTFDILLLVVVQLFVSIVIVYFFLNCNVQKS